jgi:PAS domain S-box-containing protein
MSLRVYWPALLFLCCLLPASAAVSAPQEDILDLQLRWHHQFQFAGYYAALEKGYYQAEGLEVRLHEGDPAHQPVPEVLAGHAQYAEGNGEVLYQRLQGKPLVALAAIFQHSPSVLLTRRDSGIDSVHKLIGKKVMLMNMTEDADFLSMLLNENVSLQQLNVIPSSYDLDDLITGKVEAFNSYLTNEPYFLKQRNIAYNVIDPSNYRIDFYSDILFTSAAELRDHPQRVEAMRRATLKGWRYAMDHPDEIIDLLINKYRVEKSRDHLAFEAAEMRKLIFPDLIEIGHMNPGRWQHMAETFVRAGLVKPDYSLEGFIYDTTPKHLPEWAISSLVAAILALLVVSSVTYHLLRLNRRLASAQGTLRENGERLRLAMQAAREGWFDLNIQTGVVTVAAEYAGLLGYEHGEFQSSMRIWLDKVHPDDRPLLQTAFDSALQTGKTMEIAYRRQHRAGHWCWLDAMGKVVEWDKAGKPLRMIGVSMDISERKQSELALRNYKGIVESTDDAIISKTLEGIITSWNPGAEKIFGYSAGEAIGSSMLMLIPPGKTDEEGDILKRIARGERVEHYDCVRQHKDGRLINISATISPMYDECGKVVGASKIAKDFTARKQIDAELEEYRHHLESMIEERTAALNIAKEAAEAASRAKSTFLANMSHELRTPMNAIMGMTALALRRTDEPAVREHLAKIDRASKHLLEIINDILDISKIEADRLTLEQRSFKLGEVLENMLSLIRHRAVEKGLSLAIDLPPNLDTLTLNGDPLRLGQIFLNLAGNAVKFTVSGSIRLHLACAEDNPHDVLLHCAVTDTGIGIAAADQQRLFSAFEQADGSMTRKHGGTGLGLAITKRLVHLMGGEIGVDSTPGHGSSFWFTVRLGKADNVLPAATPQTGQSEEWQLRTRHAGARILLAEDEPINQEVSRGLLEDLGLCVDLAGDGAEALLMAQQQRYALILMDMQMPNLNGLDAAQAIRADSLNRGTAILALTANVFEEDRQTCLDAGMNDHIAKPVEPQRLYAKLLRWLELAH